MKIQIVEDDTIAATLLAASLKSLGHEARLAAGGLEAWDQFQQESVRVVISDWMMPDLDGLELCRRVRARGGDYTYFILLSQVAASGEHLDQAMAAGVDDFLTKPAKAAELKARLHVAERILQYATQVRQLQQIIPICGYCRKLRDDRNYWSQVEEYLSKQAGSSVSHGVCPDCYERIVVPQMRQMGVEPPPYPQARRVQK
jgi:sigma-B regulation protein RsbU (phosphoserine phosphatase)